MANLPAMAMPKRRDIMALFGLQIIMLVLFIIFARYGKEAQVNWMPPRGPGDGVLEQYYPMFQDVHVMIFIGFGFLMTFLRRYGYSSVGFNMLVAALVVQWALLCNGFATMSDFRFTINIKSLLDADIAAAAVLISMGVVLGRTSYLQLVLMGVIEIALFTVNFYVSDRVLKIADPGGSIVVHTFGAYFGLAVSWVLEKNKPEQAEDNGLEESSYNSDLFAMIGTLFLWLFWPSFNAGLLTGDDQHRAVINTYISLAACCVTAFAVSAAVSSDHKFDMVHVQNSTLAGGVAVGTTASLMLQPFGAMLAGMTAAVISVLGYHFLTPWLAKRMKIRDTCGVHNLHGMPGVFAGLLGVLMAFIASEDDYHYSLFEIYPARAPAVNTPDWQAAKSEYQATVTGDGRTAQGQALFQLLSLLLAIGLGIVGGLVTGAVLRSPLNLKLPSGDHYNDKVSWNLPEDHVESARSLPTVSGGVTQETTE